MMVLMRSCLQSICSSSNHHAFMGDMGPMVQGIKMSKQLLLKLCCRVQQQLGRPQESRMNRSNQKQKHEMGSRHAAQQPSSSSLLMQHRQQVLLRILQLWTQAPPMEQGST